MIPIRVSPCLTRLIHAPGFDARTFAAALDRARELPTMRIEPLGNGRVRVSARHGGYYVVTRNSCQCAGHRSHGYCRHRAWALWCHSLGIDITREVVLGWGADGKPVTQAMRDAEIAREAA